MMKTQTIPNTNNKIVDIFIIGGGINGAGIAADAAGRGLSVTLCEQNDLASATSSWSSKLIHGGLRYLEYYEFNLVRKALKEREILLRKAPHLIRPLRFIMPHDRHLRPAWMIRAGLFLYDHLSRQTLLPKSKSLNLQLHPAGEPLKGDYKKGFIYSDCQVDDSRLVILNAQVAEQHGATILTRWKCLLAKRKQDHWEITLENQHNKQQQTILARALVNAAGPWVEQVLKTMINLPTKNNIALVKGSHIVVPKLYSGHYAYILQNTDKRIVFVIPYQEKYSLIGTTDVSYHGDPGQATITDDEISYLCDIIKRYFKQAITPQDIVWRFSGVRPLHSEEAENPADISRDYVLELNDENKNAVLLSVFGGKITTYRVLSEHAMSLLKPFFPHGGDAWTKDSPLPGGDIEDANFHKFFLGLQQQYAWLPTNIAKRYAHSYGRLAEKILHNCHQIDDLGKHYGEGLYQREIDYLIKFEWAQTAEDIIWRRTKLGIELNAESIKKISAAMPNPNARSSET